GRVPGGAVQQLDGREPEVRIRLGEVLRRQVNVHLPCDVAARTSDGSAEQVAELGVEPGVGAAELLFHRTVALQAGRRQVRDRLRLPGQVAEQRAPGLVV